MIVSRTHCVPLAILLLCSSTTMATDLALAKPVVQAKCQVCHGMDGMATQAMMPHLSGQPKDYLKIQLQAYRSGQRQHQQMSIIAQSLTDADIELVADWYSSIRTTVTMPSE
jgi:cytochrome c553